MKEILLFLIGIVVGGMNAIAGGGLLLGFPALIAAGLSPLAANMTGYAVVLPGQLASIYGYRKYLRKLPARYLILLLPCLVGATIGALALRHTSSDHFGRLVPGLILFAVLLFALQPFLHFHLHRHISRKRKDWGRLWLIGLGLLPVAMYGGYFGAGFGFLMLAFLGFTKLHDVHQMNGLKNMAGFVIAGVSLLCVFSTHHINWSFGLSMAAGNAIGGYSGARFSQHFSSHIIRIVVIAIGLGAAVYLGLRTY